MKFNLKRLKINLIFSAIAYLWASSLSKRNLFRGFKLVKKNDMLEFIFINKNSIIYLCLIFAYLSQKLAKKPYHQVENHKWQWLLILVLVCFSKINRLKSCISYAIIKFVRLFLVGQQQVGWVPPPRGPVSFPRVAPAAACAGNTPAFSRYLLTRNLKSHPSHSFRLMQSSAHLPVAAFYNAAAAGRAAPHFDRMAHTYMRAPHTPKLACVCLYFFFIHPNDTMKMRHVSPAFVVRTLYWLRVKHIVKMFFICQI